MQQNVTDLGPEQHQAIDLLIAGKSVGCIAKELEIRRETLWRWRQLPAFQQLHRELQTRRQEEMRELTAEILRLSLRAIHKEAEAAQEPRCWTRLEKVAEILALLRQDPLTIAAPATTIITPD